MDECTYTDINCYNTYKERRVLRCSIDRLIQSLALNNPVSMCKT